MITALTILVDSEKLPKCADNLINYFVERAAKCLMADTVTVNVVMKILAANIALTVKI